MIKSKLENKKRSKTKIKFLRKSNKSKFKKHNQNLTENNNDLNLKEKSIEKIEKNEKVDIKLKEKTKKKEIENDANKAKNETKNSLNPSVNKIDKTKIKNENRTLKESTTLSSSELLKDPERTIFLQNVNYSATERELKEFFSKYAQVEYAKICKLNGVSKGTAFVMFKSKEDCDSILSSYSKMHKNENLDALDSLNLNLFEFQGKNLKVLKSYGSKNEIPSKKDDRRNRENLLFGLYKHFNGELNDIDKEKREYLMKSKKDNFTKNPNLLTSKTRLCIRNFSKSVDEKQLKKFIMDLIFKWIETIDDKEKKFKYIKAKKIKQVKILRDSIGQKSKVIFNFSLKLL